MWESIDHGLSFVVAVVIISVPTNSIFSSINYDWGGSSVFGGFSQYCCPTLTFKLSLWNFMSETFPHAPSPPWLIAVPCSSILAHLVIENEGLFSGVLLLSQS